MALWSVGMRSGLLRAGEVGRMDAGLASRSTRKRELGGVGLGRAYSQELLFAMRSVEAEGIQVRVYTSEADPAKKLRSLLTPTDDFHTLRPRVACTRVSNGTFTLSAHAGTARSNARLLFGYQSSPGPFAFPVAPYLLEGEI